MEIEEALLAFRVQLMICLSHASYSWLCVGDSLLQFTMYTCVQSKYLCASPSTHSQSKTTPTSWFQDTFVTRKDSGRIHTEFRRLYYTSEQSMCLNVAVATAGLSAQVSAQMPALHCD